MRLVPILVALMSLSAIGRAEPTTRPIHATGVISFEVFPGRPNYESVKDGDEPETAWILTVSNTDTKERFQLVPVDRSEDTLTKLRKNVGRSVTIAGELWEAVSGHHHTPSLITVHSIEGRADQRNRAPSVPPADDQPSPLALPVDNASRPMAGARL